MKLAFVFTGHGTQRWDMGRQLIEEEPLYRETIEDCDRIARQYVDWSIMEELLADESVSRIGRGDIQITQTAFFATQVALAKLWQSWGVEPDAVIGYCMGEVAASYLAGALSLSDALRVIIARSGLYKQALNQADVNGAMAWVYLPSHDVKKRLKAYENQLWISAHTSPFVTMLSGNAGILKDFLRSLRREKIPSRLMRIPGAGHTPHVDPLAQELVKSLKGIQPQSATIPMVSTVSGASVDGTEYDAEYWGRQLRDPIFFAEAMDTLVNQGHTVFIEISADPLLAKPILHSLKHRGIKGAALASLRSDQKDLETMVETLNRLYDLGVFPVEEPSTVTTYDAPEQEVDEDGGSVIYLEQKPVQRTSKYPVSNGTSHLDRRKGQDRRKLKLPANVIEIEFGEERRNLRDRRCGQERRTAIGG